jgi:amino acid permease
MHENWIPIVGSISLFSMIAFIVWVGNRTKARVTEMRTAFQTRMIDKFSNAAEFVDFAKTPEGQRLIQGTTGPTQKTKIFAALRTGIVLSSLGVGLLVLGIIGRFDEAAAAAGIVGTIILSLGLGFLVSAFVSRKLVRAWSAEDDETRRPLMEV